MPDSLLYLKYETCMYSSSEQNGFLMILRTFLLHCRLYSVVLRKSCTQRYNIMSYNTVLGQFGNTQKLSYGIILESVTVMPTFFQEPDRPDITVMVDWA